MTHQPTADKARAYAHYSALAAEAEAWAASRRANPGRATQPSVDSSADASADDSSEHCAAINSVNERTARLVERAIWLVLGLAIGCPLAWWLVEWAACGPARLGC